MRTVGDILEACQEQQPATEEELRLALLALYYCLHLSCPHDYEGKAPMLLELRAKDNFERKFRLMKAEPSKWLGARYTPGTKENREGRGVSKRILAGFERARLDKSGKGP